jgi:hypothetical protein
MLFLLRMQSDFCHTVWSFGGLILYTCARELIQINRNSQEGQGIESKSNFVAGVCRNCYAILSSVCGARDADNRKI